MEMMSRVNKPAMLAGIMMLIGTATFFMICFPIVMKISGGSSFIVLLSVNQVPQKTPVTRTSNIPVSNCKVFRGIDLITANSLPSDEIDGFTVRVNS